MSRMCPGEQHFNYIRKKALNSLITPQFSILVTFHQDPSLSPGLSSKPICNSVQIGRHIKYKGLCKLNSLLFYNERNFITYLYITLNLISLINVTTRLKICPTQLKADFFKKIKIKTKRISSIVS